MINLLETTFIIPIYIESDDRMNNAISTLGYLNNHFKTNVIIHELVDDGQTKLSFIKSLKNLRIKHIIQDRNFQNYHRTKQLNEMLNVVDTFCVVNYDIDVILPVKSYIVAETLILNEFCDVVYPYGFGKFQKKVDKTFDRKRFNKDFNLQAISADKFFVDRAEYGHCIFFNTNKYKLFGGENENFVSYGPEDYERFKRFEKLGSKVERIEDFVYHLEHSRTAFSSEENPDFQKNVQLLKNLESKDRFSLLDYYTSVDYRLKYNFDKKVSRTKPQIDNIEQNVVEINPADSQIKYFSVPNRNLNLCACGHPKDKVRYNFCQKCNRLY
jgi:hypothetical protein